MVVVPLPACSITGTPFFIAATAELEVPKSMPMAARRDTLRAAWGVGSTIDGMWLPRLGVHTVLRASRDHACPHGDAGALSHNIVMLPMNDDQR